MQSPPSPHNQIKAEEVMLSITDDGSIVVKPYELAELKIDVQIRRIVKKTHWIGF